MKKNRILIVDDDPNLLKLISIRLRSAGYVVDCVESAQQGLAKMNIIRPDVVITDLRMDGMDGMSLFKEINSKNPMLPVIILTAHGTIPDAVNAIKNGVFSFLTKPYESKTLLEYINKALVVSGNSKLNSNKDEVSEWCKDIVTRSPVMEELIMQIDLVAQGDASVFIFGASGTGKELLAKAIHEAGPRRDQSFVGINCSAIPEALLESELFGHTKGSFTGATKEHKGLFQVADGGTLFLDEVGDMPLFLQIKLLRVLQENMIRPVGSTENISVDVRIISATHKNLDKEIAEGFFREDLFYRLNVVSFEVPSLADRPGDIPLLVKHFLGIMCKKTSKKVTLSPEAMELLMTAPWPGNVRQLRNVIEQVVTLSRTQIISPSLVERALRNPAVKIMSFAEAKSRFEMDYLSHLLQITGGKVKQAASLAGCHRTNFYKLLERNSLEPNMFKYKSLDD